MLRFCRAILVVDYLVAEQFCVRADFRNGDDPFFFVARVLNQQIVSEMKFSVH